MRFVSDGSTPKPASIRSANTATIETCRSPARQKKLITDFGRIRDVAMGDDGLVYIVLEHNGAGSLWRMVPG